MILKDLGLSPLPLLPQHLQTSIGESIPQSMTDRSRGGAEKNLRRGSGNLQDFIMMGTQQEFQPFPHGTGRLSVSYAYLALEGQASHSDCLSTALLPTFLSWSSQHMDGTVSLSGGAFQPSWCLGLLDLGKKSKCYNSATDRINI